MVNYDLQQQKEREKLDRNYEREEEEI